MRPATAPSATAPRCVPFLVADSFVLALDDFMRRTHQGGHVSQSILELGAAPDLAGLRAGLQRAVAKHPILLAQPRRNFWTRLPYWQVDAPAADATLPLGLWVEAGAPQHTDFAKAKETPSVWQLVQRLGDDDAQSPNARLDAVALKDGGFWLILTWSHLLLDGKGAELLCAELARLSDGIDIPEENAGEPGRRSKLSLWQKFRRTRPAMDYQTSLQETGVPSLGGPRPRPSQPNYSIVTFDVSQTATIRTRAEQLGGGLFPITFYVACVARAQDRVFRARGLEPPGYGISIPAQTRKRGARGPLFHNHVAPLFFNPRRAHLVSLAETATAMRAQFATMVRHKVAESFDAVLDLMRPLPSWLFLAIIRAQFKGELCTCYSSHTGSFAPGMQTFAAAPVLNAYHLPCLGIPPGTGIFFGEHADRLNMTVSWRDGALSEQERILMTAQLRNDLLGSDAT